MTGRVVQHLPGNAEPQLGTRLAELGLGVPRVFALMAMYINP